MTAALMLEALDSFVDHASAAAKLKRLAPLERRVERGAARAFLIQERAFLRGFARLRPQFPEVREAIRNEDWEPILERAQDMVKDWLSKLIDGAASDALRVGAEAAIAAAGVDFDFTIEDPRAVAFLLDRGARQVTAINETTRDDIRAILIRTVAEKRSYAEAAKAIGDYFLAARSVPPTKAEARKLRSRARLIGITEVGEAYEEGNLIAAGEVESLGVAMEKSWLTVGDDRVSDGCRENQSAGWISLHAAFPSGHQRPLRFPGCRCALLTRPKGVA